MDSFVLERQFARVGARAQLRKDARRVEGVSIDIGRDRAGEYFDIAIGAHAPELSVLDIQPKLRHLLLLSRQEESKAKFLCGHDERHWFVAAVPERGGASTVRNAFEILKPAAVRAELYKRNVRTKQRNKRRNDAFIRQGEWFFVPSNVPEPNRLIVLHHEQLRRGSGKPHLCEELVRLGGDAVYVSHQHPNGISPAEYQKLISRRPELRHIGWVSQRRNPTVYVRGRVKHADHKTIYLDGWHRVLMNTETESVAMRHVAFID